jgi:hypothetical protein
MIPFRNGQPFMTTKITGHEGVLCKRGDRDGAHFSQSQKAVAHAATEFSYAEKVKFLVIIT